MTMDLTKTAENSWPSSKSNVSPSYMSELCLRPPTSSVIVPLVHSSYHFYAIHATTIETCHIRLHIITTSQNHLLERTKMGSSRYFAVKAWERHAGGTEKAAEGKDGQEGCGVKEGTEVKKKKERQ
jgi:hypothetical protein